MKPFVLEIKAGLIIRKTICSLTASVHQSSNARHLIPDFVNYSAYVDSNSSIRTFVEIQWVVFEKIDFDFQRQPSNFFSGKAAFQGKVAGNETNFIFFSCSEK